MIKTKKSNILISALLCLSMALSVGMAAGFGGMFSGIFSNVEAREGDRVYAFNPNVVLSTAEDRTSVTDPAITALINDPLVLPGAGTQYFHYNSAALNKLSSSKTLSPKPDSAESAANTQRLTLGKYAASAVLVNNKYSNGVYFKPAASTQALTVRVWGGGNSGRSLNLVAVDATTPTLFDADDIVATGPTDGDNGQLLFEKSIFGDAIADMYAVTTMNTAGEVYLRYIEVIENDTKPTHYMETEIVATSSCTEMGVEMKYCVIHYPTFDAAKAALLAATSKTKLEDVENGTYLDGEIEITVSPLLAHSYGIWNYAGTGAVEPTLTTAGKQTRLCACGDTQLRDVPKLKDEKCVDTYTFDYSNYAPPSGDYAFAADIDDMLFYDGASGISWITRSNAKLNVQNVGGDGSVWKDFNADGSALELKSGDKMIRFQPQGPSQNGSTNIDTRAESANHTTLMPDKGYFKFSVDGPAVLSVWAVSGKEGEKDRSIVFYKGDATTGVPTQAIGFKDVTSDNSAAPIKLTFEMTEAGNYAFGFGYNASNVYAIRISSHDWIVDATTDANGWKQTKEPNCEEKGVLSRVCDECGMVETQDIDELDFATHDMGWTVTKEAGCEPGVRHGVCKNEGCNYETDTPIAVTAHKHDVKLYNGTTLLATIQYDCGDAIASIPAQTVAGYTFKGWYTDAALTKAYVSGTEFTGDISLYAKFEKDETSSGGCGTIGFGDMGGLFLMMAGMVVLVAASSTIKRRKAQSK